MTAQEQAKLGDHVQFIMGEEKCGPGTEGCRDRRARTRAPLRFTAERGDHEQIKQNKVPNPTSQRLNQGQVCGPKTKVANDSGSAGNATLIHSTAGTVLVTQGASGTKHFSK